MKQRSIARDTLLLSFVQLFLQGLSLLVNIFLTKRIGSASVGVISLIGSFFGLMSVLSSGNSFLVSSRMISEELGKSCGNPKCVLRYALTASATLSVAVGSVVFVFAPTIADRALHLPEIMGSVRILAFVLPFSALTASLKGFFHAKRTVVLPALADTLEFLIRTGILVFCVSFLLPRGHMSIYTAIALSTLVGQLTAFAMLLIGYLRTKLTCTGACSLSVFAFLGCSFPILLNSYLTSILSSANDALIPLTLRQFGDSTDAALSQFGVFEAILLPALFFPSMGLCCLSNILVPELSRKRAAKQPDAVNGLVERVLRLTLDFSVFVVLFLLLFGQPIGERISNQAYAGRMLQLLAPVIPFIYLEIVLEAILRGLGKQNFSSANYLAEYIIRISVLLVSVPLFGFYGIVMSYYASNVVGNLVRLWMVLKLTGLKPSWRCLIGYPIGAAFFLFQMAKLLQRLSPGVSFPVSLAAFVLVGGVSYLFILRVLSMQTGAKKPDPHKACADPASGMQLEKV